MGKKPKQIRPSFYQIFLKDSSLKLRLPALFVQKYREILPEKAKIRASSGRGAWNVKLERMGDGQYCFTEGWAKFREDAGLEFGECLVFWLNCDESMFDVEVLGKNGCDRGIPDVKNEESRGRGRACVMEDEDTKDSDDHNTWKEENPRMKLMMNESRRSRVSLRKDFAEGARLIGKKAMVLEYVPRHRYGAVVLDSPKNISQFKLDMTGGWNEFWKSNKLVFGKTYSLEFNPSKNVVQVWPDID